MRSLAQGVPKSAVTYSEEVGTGQGQCCWRQAGVGVRRWADATGGPWPQLDGPVLGGPVQVQARR